MQLTNATNQKTASITLRGSAKDRVSSILRTITSSPKIAFGVGVVIFFVLVAIAAPLLTPYDPTASIIKGSLPPSWSHIFGTTGLGQDTFAQIVYGARVTLLVAFVAAIGSTILQVVMGLSSAYYGGMVDEVLSLIINVFLVLPGLPLTIVLASLASASGANKNEFVIALEFLGLGDTSRPSWGVILYWAQNNAALIVGKWWQFVPAGLCIALLCAGLAFINFGIDELANPRLRTERPLHRRLSSGKKKAGA